MDWEYRKLNKNQNPTFLIIKQDNTTRVIKIFLSIDLINIPQLENSTSMCHRNQNQKCSRCRKPCQLTTHLIKSQISSSIKIAILPAHPTFRCCYLYKIFFVQKYIHLIKITQLVGTLHDIPQLEKTSSVMWRGARR